MPFRPEQKANMWRVLEFRSNETVAENYSGHYSRYLFTQEAIDVASKSSCQQTRYSYKTVFCAFSLPGSLLATVSSFRNLIPNHMHPSQMITARDMLVWQRALSENALNITIALQKYDLFMEQKNRTVRDVSANLLRSKHSRWQYWDKIDTKRVLMISFVYCWRFNCLILHIA